jgi:hypothetical protein
MAAATPILIHLADIDRRTDDRRQGPGRRALDRLQATPDEVARIGRQLREEGEAPSMVGCPRDRWKVSE